MVFDMESVPSLPPSATSVDEALDFIRSKRLVYPVLVAPWNSDQSNAMQHIVNSDTELQEAVEQGLRDASHDERVHLIQLTGKRDSGAVSPSQ